MKNFLKVLIPPLFLVFLAACAAQPPEPTPTETPQLPATAEIVAAYFKAISEKRTEDALSYLAEDVRLLFGGEVCLSGKYARVGKKDSIEQWGQRELIGENYRVDGDIVHLDYKESSDGIIFEEGSTSYSVSDGLIQWQGGCQP